jgi:DNA-binding HxlR family transcriptional regulator
VKKKKIEFRSDCPISTALDIFGDKWSLLVIRDVLFNGKSTYGEFLNSEEKIATNILADRLLQLEAGGLTCTRGVKNNPMYIRTRKNSSRQSARIRRE